jgi:hypothetical protein
MDKQRIHNRTRYKSLIAVLHLKVTERVFQAETTACGNGL